MMNASFLRAIAGGEHRMPLCADNLLVDLDLHEDNLPTGTSLRIGAAVCEVTYRAHIGCSKFERPYGMDALNFTNSKTCEAQRLRALFIPNHRTGLIRLAKLSKHSFPSNST